MLWKKYSKNTALGIGEGNVRHVLCYIPGERKEWREVRMYIRTQGLVPWIICRQAYDLERLLKRKCWQIPWRSKRRMYSVDVCEEFHHKHCCVWRDEKNNRLTATQKQEVATTIPNQNTKLILRSDKDFKQFDIRRIWKICEDHYKLNHESQQSKETAK